MINDPNQEKEIEIKIKLKIINEYIEKGLVGSKQLDVILRRLEEVKELVASFDEWEG